jgi:NAD(P)-dependent dehydrogenase (short-subunit alcohol dehydrogenase family)
MAATPSRHIVVTGAGTGIGRAIARRLDRDGASLTLLARDRDRLEATADLLEHPTNVVACDIRDRGKVEKGFAGAADMLGPIHALVACSGLGGANGGDAGSDRFDDLVATNLNGTYYCCRAALQRLAPGPEPRHLVVMSSILARIPVPDYTGYSASKAGLLGLVRSLAATLGGENIQVNAICPGWVDTDMAWRGLDGIAASTGRTREDAYRDAMRAVPLGRMGQPDDIAGTVAWLLSPDARGVTGQAIDQNGGAWMG